MEAVKDFTAFIANNIETLCEGQPAWKIVTTSAFTTIAVLWIREILAENDSLYELAKKTVLKLLRKVSYVQAKIDKELDKLSLDMIKEMNNNTGNDAYFLHLPAKGYSTDEILKKADYYAQYGNFKWKEGFTSGTVYNGSEPLTDLMTEVYGMAVWSNPLHTDVFPGVRKMEAEVVRMCCSMFNGSAESCGTMTTGGTESIIMACKAYRNYAMEERGIKKPEILAPITAHAAFDKAAQLLNMKIKHAPIDPKTMKVDVKAVARMISKNTCVIVGSAPQFPHGVIDPIEALAALGVKHNIPVHVDACLGGFLIAFAAEAGFLLPPFDFRVRGVTSISCDTHKYGYTPKGSSVILYRESKFRHHQFFVQTDWPGGIYATPAISGSRPGGIIAASWAALMYHGRQGYVESTTKIIHTAKVIEEGCRNIPGIVVMGKPEVSVVAFCSDKFNIFTLSDAMTKKGWHLNPLQFPSAIHLAVTYLHTKEGVAERFLSDVRSIAEDLIQNPPKEIGGSAVIYGLAQSLPDRTVVDDVARCYLDAYYITDIPSNGV